MENKKYKLLDEHGVEYISEIPGTLGGNKKLKIYGKLDCPSAKRWIEKGYYIENRVFFANEEVAISAGYRPCAVCMPKEYKIWKREQQTNATLKYYDDNANEYYEQTVNGDMSEVYKRFLMLLPDKAYILDFGCGSGRDSKYFLEHGYTVTAIDGSGKLCDLASKYIGQKVECMRFEELKDKDKYDGIWACSSILHVERENLPDILRKMLTALKEEGVMFASFKKGDKCEVIDGKYYNYLTKELFEKLLHEADPNSKIVDYFESGVLANVNRPVTTWGSYLIKKK